MVGGGMAMGGEGAGAEGGSVSETAGARGGIWVAGCALHDGGVHSVSAGDDSSSGAASLAGLKATTAAGYGNGEQGEFIKAGSGPWKEGRWVSGVGSGATRWARPGKMKGSLAARKLRFSSASVNSAFIVDARDRKCVCAVA